jgi:hypothetical protein
VAILFFKAGQIRRTRTLTPHCQTLRTVSIRSSPRRDNDSGVDANRASDNILLCRNEGTLGSSNRLLDRAPVAKGVPGSALVSSSGHVGLAICDRGKIQSRNQTEKKTAAAGIIYVFDDWCVSRQRHIGYPQGRNVEETFKILDI